MLQMKPGCNVILVWNKSDDLKNSTMGVFTGVRGNDLLVNFEEVGIVRVSQEMWIKRDRNGQGWKRVTVPDHARLRSKLSQVSGPHFAICSCPLFQGLCMWHHLCHNFESGVSRTFTDP